MRDVRTKIKALNKFFGPLKLRDIHIGHLREFQKARFSNEDGLWAHTAGANKINAELGLVLRILRLGEACSSTIEKYYVGLQVEECEIPKALSQEEQDRFLRIAASRPEWAVVYWYSLLAVHVAFSSDELRTLRQGDINLMHQIVAVNRKAGKNKFRRREVPLTDSAAVWALERLLDRSISLGGRSPEKYLFPARASRGHFNGDISEQAERLAMQSMNRGRRFDPPPPERPPQAPPVDLINPAIQAEIVRQVAMALHREREQNQVPAAQSPPPRGPRVIRFPGAG